MSSKIPTPSETMAEEIAEEGVAADHAAAEGAPTGDKMGSTSALREMMLSTEPSPPLHAVESPYDPEAGGAARVYRGFQKATGTDGVPAVIDILSGLFEMWMQAQTQGDSEGSESDGEQPPFESTL